MQKLAADLAGASLDQVKAVYEDMAANDRTLTGMGSYTDLGLALQKHGVRLYISLYECATYHMYHISVNKVERKTLSEVMPFQHI